MVGVGGVLHVSLQAVELISTEFCTVGALLGFPSPVLTRFSPLYTPGPFTLYAATCTQYLFQTKMAVSIPAVDKRFEQFIRLTLSM